MRWERILWGALIGLALGMSPAGAQTQFSCGSTGADGALVVPSGQTVSLDVPDDGIFNYTTITVSGELQFNRNTRFDAPVILLATGDVVVNGSGFVRVNGTGGTPLVGGSGGPGGFDGGAAGIAAGEPGAGHGPGAGGAGLGSLVGGNAGYGTDPPNTNHPTDGVAYGSPLLIPLVGGSGGGGDTNLGGGGGGGAILLCSPTQTVINGRVEAVAAISSFLISSYGSGGAVRIVSPSVRGTGSVNVTGGRRLDGTAFGGPGRIRVDLIDRSGLTLSFVPPNVVSVGSFMSVFPSTVPRLDIVHVAGNDIPTGTPSPLVFTLPFNAPANQPITVRATGFSGIVPVSVVVTPDSGDRIVVDTQIDADLPPAEVTVNVDFTQNVTTRIHAWTR